jgi:hypothetical protein
VSERKLVTDKMNDKNFKVLRYVGIAVVLAISLFLLTRPQVGVAIQVLAGVPAVCSLLGVLFLLLRDEITHQNKVLRDELAHERNLKIKNSENTFSIGATSHIANVAFDKHVQFCEEYIVDMSRVAGNLLRKAPNKEALADAGSLAAIRRNWVVWLTPDTEDKLDRFEDAVYKIGAKAILLDDGGMFENRAQVVKETYEIYSEILGLKDLDGEKIFSDRGVEAVIENLRKVLGIRELTQLRTKLVERALANLDEHEPPDIELT